MSKAKLRKKLETLPKENVINLIMSLYDASKEAKTYLSFIYTRQLCRGGEIQEDNTE